MTSIEYLNTIINDKSIINIDGNMDDLINIEEKNTFDYIFFELENNKYLNLNTYIIGIIECVIHILDHQKKGGFCIIKINDIVYKPIVDIIYILCNLYNKICLIKPNTSNIVLPEKYIVCEGFNNINNQHICKELKNIVNFYNSNIKQYVDIIKITSLLNNNIQYFFKNKLEEFNIILGQQQLDSLNQIIGILKNKNKEEKIESYKKTNILKSIAWCEKYKIPCNKFTEKVNIFLPLINKVNETNEDNKNV